MLHLDRETADLLNANLKLGQIYFLPGFYLLSLEDATANYPDAEFMDSAGRPPLHCAALNDEATARALLDDGL